MGWTDEPWVATVVDHLGRGAYRNLARRATEKRMTAAGNVSGELLCWIAVTGAMGDTRPSFLETDRGRGHPASGPGAAGGDEAARKRQSGRGARRRKLLDQQMPHGLLWGEVKVQDRSAGRLDRR